VTTTTTPDMMLDDSSSAASSMVRVSPFNPDMELDGLYPTWLMNYGVDEHYQFNQPSCPHLLETSSQEVATDLMSWFGVHQTLSLGSPP
jgi:hypothetical protein